MAKLKYKRKCYVNVSECSLFSFIYFYLFIFIYMSVKQNNKVVSRFYSFQYMLYI